MAATYKDIQRLTGLSLSTISKYFNGGRVSPKNREDIKAAAGTLDFRVNVFAQSLKSRRSRVIGLLVPELNGVFVTTVMSEVGHFLRKQGYGILVCDCHSEASLEAEMLEFLLSRQVDGVIAVVSGPDVSYLKTVKEHKTPIVIIDRLFDDLRFDTALLDNRKAGGMAAEFLLQNGHKNVGYISGPNWFYAMNKRKWGFWRMMQQHGIKPDPDNFMSGNYSIEVGREITLTLLNKKDRPTALFAANDLLTLGMVIAVQQLGLSVPEDISLIGFDSVMFEGVLGKQLTMITQPIEELAELASLLMLDQIENAIPAKRRISMVQPILRRGATVRDVSFP